MGLEEFRDSLSEEIQGITSSDFTVVITETDEVPSVDDPDITYPNLITKQQKCKLIETCVLYIDIRRSTNLSFSHRRSTLTKLYSSFARAMARCGSYYGGKVRSIIGDRLMVIFDAENCFTNAVNTAILMNSVSKHLLDKHFAHDEIKCGIGIDYGKMLASKAGIIKRGTENTAYKSIVWLGRPANIASKLTDRANRTTSTARPIVIEGHYYRYLKDWGWYEVDTADFLDKLEKTSSPVLRHPSENFKTFIRSSRTTSQTSKPILMTEPVFKGYKGANPKDPSVTNSWWKPQSVYVPGYSNQIYGGDVVFTVFKDD
jgi:adenylate cyclase